MIPLRDNIPSRTTPFVTYGVIALCALGFLAQLAADDQGQSIVQRYGMVPARLTHGDAELIVRQRVLVQTPWGVEERVVEERLPPPAIPPWMTMVSCMFLHGGWMHFLGNMWFLYIFGDNVEDRLGHLGYALLYLGTGVVAGLSQLFSEPSGVVPTIGASGAIAGVMGAYAWFYPHARVQAILPLIIIIQVFVLPAPVFLGIWFVIQTFSGLNAAVGGAATNVAWWAHVGGFVAGGLVALAVGRLHWDHRPVTERRF